LASVRDELASQGETVSTLQEQVRQAEAKDKRQSEKLATLREQVEQMETVAARRTAEQATKDRAAAEVKSELGMTQYGS
jgi:uncharacterized coiled-coil protein SlyX